MFHCITSIQNNLNTAMHKKINKYKNHAVAEEKYSLNANCIKMGKERAQLHEKTSEH